MPRLTSTAQASRTGDPNNGATHGLPTPCTHDTQPVIPSRSYNLIKRLIDSYRCSVHCLLCEALLGPLVFKFKSRHQVASTSFRSDVFFSVMRHCGGCYGALVALLEMLASCYGLSLYSRTAAMLAPVSCLINGLFLQWSFVGL